MRWFEGSISDAVASSKARNAVFVVFVEGPDDVSRSVSTAINTSEVSSKLESSDFVAIKLDSGTEPYRQFAQIYQVVPVPSLFFIGRDGRPLEIVAGTSSPSEIAGRIEAILAKANGRASGVEASTSEAAGRIEVARPPSETSRPSPTREEVAKTARPSREDGAADRAPEAAGGETEAEAATNKLEEAKALVERNRARKLEEDKAAERDRETERRKVGQEVQRLRQWQQDQEYKQLKEDREREKREEKAARDRVRKQIAQDRAERTKKKTLAQERKEKEMATRKPMEFPPNSAHARLQLRLPEGVTIAYQTPGTTTLGELRAYVCEQLDRTPSSFTLTTSYPRRLLAPADDAQTMAELELTPTAIILIQPASSGGIVRAGASIVTPVTQLFWALLTPLLSVFAYVKNLVFGRAGGQTGGVSGGVSGGRGGPQPSAQGGPSRRMPSTSEVRRQGNSNIHRLAQARDSSDEDNNTWNGNSTQQM